MSSDSVVIDVRDLGKRYEIYETPRDRLKQLVVPGLQHLGRRAGASFGLAPSARPPACYFQEFWALHDVSFSVRAGETFGIIGRNGSGKSTLLQLIAGTLTPTLGDVTVVGRVAALLELGSGFNPEFSGRENVFLNGRILGLTQREIAERLDEILAFADIGEFIDQPVKTYSSGMFVRLAFAVQAHIDASIVIIDEALAVGDVFFRQKCYARLEQLRQGGAAILLVSHAMTEIEQFCERAILLDHGRLKFSGAASMATKHYYLLNQPAAVAALEEADRAERVAWQEASVEAAAPLAGAHADDPDAGDLLVPEPAAFVDPAAIEQVGSGAARCVALALCDDTGRARNVFRQGEFAVLHYEFQLDRPIEAPVCGAVITSDRGVIVHGKNTQQYGTAVPLRLAAGTRLVCQQRIRLDIGTGEYSFEVGLAGMSLEDWARREHLSYEQFEALIHRHCHVPAAGRLSVGFAIRNGVPVLTHHGAADLPGSIRMARR
jgi:lipopolysaccharide transport system ATP-binding protein